MYILTVTLVVLCVFCIVCYLYNRLSSAKQILMLKKLRPPKRSILAFLPLTSLSIKELISVHPFTTPCLCIRNQMPVNFVLHKCAADN